MTKEWDLLTWTFSPEVIIMRRRMVSRGYEAIPAPVVTPHPRRKLGRRNALGRHSRAEGGTRDSRGEERSLEVASKDDGLERVVHTAQEEEQRRASAGWRESENDKRDRD